MLSGTHGGRKISSGGIAGRSLPRPEPEEREPDLREDARALEAALRRGRTRRRRRMCAASTGSPGEPQRDVGLDRSWRGRRAAEEVGPGAVVALLRADPAAPSAASARRCGCRGTGAAADPRRPWSRSSASSPFHQPVVGLQREQPLDAAVERRCDRVSTAGRSARLVMPQPASWSPAARRAQPARLRDRSARRPPSSPASRCPSTRRRGRDPGARRDRARPVRAVPGTPLKVARGSRVTKKRRDLGDAARREAARRARAGTRRAARRRERVDRMRPRPTARPPGTARRASPEELVRSKTHCTGVPTPAANGELGDRAVVDDVQVDDRRGAELREPTPGERAAAAAPRLLVWHGEHDGVGVGVPPLRRRASRRRRATRDAGARVRRRRRPLRARARPRRRAAAAAARAA